MLLKMYTYKYYVILNTTLHIIIDSPKKVKHHLTCFNKVIDRFVFMCI